MRIFRRGALRFAMRLRRRSLGIARCPARVTDATRMLPRSGLMYLSTRLASVARVLAFLAFAAGLGRGRPWRPRDTGRIDRRPSRPCGRLLAVRRIGPADDLDKEARGLCPRHVWRPWGAMAADRMPALASGKRAVFEHSRLRPRSIAVARRSPSRRLCRDPRGQRRPLWPRLT